MRQVVEVAERPYQPHELHRGEQVWSEKNCSVDVWIELLNALGLDPVPAAAFVLSTDFQAEQWSFLKFPTEDLRTLYGIEVEELNIWRPLIDHVETQMQHGRLLTVEVDAWHLPDTVGTSYHAAHVKSTIVPNLINRGTARMEYFHAAGYWELSGEDFHGIFPRSGEATIMPPYVEIVRLDRLQIRPDLAEIALELARSHFCLRPHVNPVARWSRQLRTDVAWLQGQPLEVFHLYAFAMVRQYGAAAELANRFLAWLADKGQDVPTGAASQFAEVATAAKTLQFQLARLASGRSADVGRTLDEIESTWAQAFDRLGAWLL